MHTAVRGAIMLNDTGLLEAMLAEQNVMDVIGALECDPCCKPYVTLCWHRPPAVPRRCTLRSRGTRACQAVRRVCQCEVLLPCGESCAAHARRLQQHSQRSSPDSTCRRTRCPETNEAPRSL